MGILCDSKKLVLYVFACGHYCCLYVSMSGDGKILCSASKHSEITAMLGQTGFHLSKI